MGNQAHATKANSNNLVELLVAEKQLLVIFADEAEKNDYLKQVKLRLHKNSSLHLFETDDAESVLAEVLKFRAGVLFFCIRTQQEFLVTLGALTALQHVIEDGSLRVIGACDLEDPEVLKTLRLRGAEVFPLSLEWKALEKKIERPFEILREENPDSVRVDVPLIQEMKIWLASKEPGKNILVEVQPLEFGEGTLLLDVKSKIFTEGQEVLLTVDTDSRSSKAKRDFMTKIREVITTGGERDAVEVSSNSEIEAHLSVTRKAQEKVQAQIHDFFKAARGW